MTYLFPGMDPYLEHPDVWPEVHNRLIVALANAIEPHLSQNYRVAIEKRTYTSVPEDSILVGIPDVAVLSQSSQSVNPIVDSFSDGAIAQAPPARSPITVTLPMPQSIREGYLEIRDVAAGFVVTVIELLSPSNKRSGKGQESYNNKRMAILASPTHLVEIDLLRTGQSPTILTPTPVKDYHILVSRGDRRPQAEFYGFSIRQSIPTFTLPLHQQDEEPTINLQALVQQIYQQARFRGAIDYERPAVPPLDDAEQTWVREWLSKS